MKTKTKNNMARKWFLIASVIGAVALSAAWAGDLEPSAPPAAGGTMKTLDEVEPRVPVNDDTAPSDVYYEHVISSSGSYYLTGDITTIKGGIQITANNVTLDLCGYNLIGDAGNNRTGLDLDSQSNVEVRNGTVRSFGYDGVMQNYVSATDHRIIGIRAIDNGQTGSGKGIYVHGTNHLIKDCIASGNSGYGFYVPGGSSTIAGCKSYNNSYGFYTGYGCVIRDNTAYGNANSGIYTGSGCTVTGNTAYANDNSGIYTGSGCTVTGNTAYANDSFGIYTGSGCTVQNNTAYANFYYGIHTGEGCTIIGNTSRANTNQGGIWVDDKSTVVGNTATDNTGYGIYCSQNCLVDQNTAVDNTNNMYSYNCTLGTNRAP